MSDDKVIEAHNGERRIKQAETMRARNPSAGWQAYSNWLNRVQGGNGNAGVSGGRHGAITRNLNSWSHYKTWADKVRNSWDRDK